MKTEGARKQRKNHEEAHRDEFGDEEGRRGMQRTGKPEENKNAGSHGGMLRERGGRVREMEQLTMNRKGQSSVQWICRRRQFPVEAAGQHQH